MAKHLDPAAIASTSPAGGLGHSAWQFDWLHVVSEGTQMPVCIYKHAQVSGIDKKACLNLLLNA